MAGKTSTRFAVLNLRHAGDSSDILPKALYYQNVSWRHDNSGFYYSVLTEQGARVRFHQLGPMLRLTRNVAAKDWVPTG